MPNAARTRRRTVTTSTDPFTTLGAEHAAIPRQPGQPMSEEALSRDRQFQDQAGVMDRLRQARLAAAPAPVTRARTRNRDQSR